MYQVFNMGQRLELYTAPSAADAIIEQSKQMNIHAQVIGRVEKSPDKSNSVLVKSPHGEFEYKE